METNKIYQGDCLELMKQLDNNSIDLVGKVLGDLKAILGKKPTLKTFSVSKQGTGLNTKYTVIPLD